MFCRECYSCYDHSCLASLGLQQGAGLVGAGTKLLTNERSASTEVFKNNITDLYTVDKNEWKSTDTQNDIDKKWILNY